MSATQTDQTFNLIGFALWLLLYETGIKEIKTLTCQKNNNDKTFSVGTIVASSLLKDATKHLENVKQNYFLIFELYT